MVDALRNAWRVLRRGGHVVDLHPASVYHPQLAVDRGRRRIDVGRMRRDPDLDVAAAQRASARAVRERLFAPVRRIRQRWISRYPSVADIDRVVEVNDNWHMPRTTRRRLERTWRVGDDITVSRVFYVVTMRRRGD